MTSHSTDHLEEPYYEQIKLCELFRRPCHFVISFNIYIFYVAIFFIFVFLVLLFCAEPRKISELFMEANDDPNEEKKEAFGSSCVTKGKLKKFNFVNNW